MAFAKWTRECIPGFKEQVEKETERLAKHNGGCYGGIRRTAVKRVETHYRKYVPAAWPWLSDANPPPPPAFG